MSRYRSRKFILAMATLGALTWLRLEHEITVEAFEGCLKALLAVYMTGNVAQKVFAKKEQAE